MSDSDDSPIKIPKSKGKSRKKANKVLDESSADDEPQTAASKGSPKPSKKPSKSKSPIKPKELTKEQSKKVLNRWSESARTESSSEESPARSSKGSPGRYSSDSARSSASSSSTLTDSMREEIQDMFGHMGQVIEEMFHFTYFLRRISKREEVLTEGNVDMCHLKKLVRELYDFLYFLIHAYRVEQLEHPPDIREFLPLVIDKSPIPEEERTQKKCYEIQRLVTKALAKLKRRAQHFLDHFVVDGEILGSEFWEQKGKYENDVFIQLLKELIEWVEKHPSPSISLISKDKDGKRKVITFSRSDVRIEGKKVSKTLTKRISSIARYDKDPYEGGSQKGSTKGSTKGIKKGGKKGGKKGSKKGSKKGAKESDEE